MKSVVREKLVVVGGGPAGAAAACLLAREGHAPMLLERDAAPRHKICGEFVSVEARAYLAELGIDVLALGGVPIQQVRVVNGNQTAEALLPFEGVGLTRRKLDATLLAQAVAHGAQVRRGEVVRSVIPQGSHLDVRVREGGVIQAETVFLANGKHDLHTPKRPVAENNLVGFKTYFTLSSDQQRSLGGAVEVILFEGGYAGLQPVEGGMANLCLLVERRVFEAAGRQWPQLLNRLCAASPHLRCRLTGSRALLDRPLTISRVPYGFIYQPQLGDIDGLFRLGDQMGVIPSFCGDGIAIALHSAHRSTAVYAARGNAADIYHREMAADVRRQISLAMLTYQLSQMTMARQTLLIAFRLFPGLLSTLALHTRIPMSPASGQ
jgi:flavin-dependent dehydrogenase